MSDSNVEALRKLLLERSERGILKYGTTTDRGDLSLLEWHQHHLEELLDAAVYTMRIIKELDGKPELKVGDEVRWKHSGAVGTLEVVTGARSVAVRHGDGSIKMGHMNELEATL